jgi:hypothetical protein
MPTLSNQRFRVALLGSPEAGAVRMSCRDAGCENERSGWAVVLDPDDAKHAGAMRFIEGNSGRRFIKLGSDDAADWIANHAAAQGVTDNAGRLATLVANTAPGLVIYVFPPGQQCFRIHVDREVQFTHRDRRGVMRLHDRPVDFNEHMNEEGDRVNRLLQRG